jgi:hypothetical protein
MRRPSVRTAVAGALSVLLLSPVATIAGHALGPPSTGSVDCAALRGDPVHRFVLGQLDNWLRWLRTYHVRGVLGEFGWPDNSSGDGADWNCMAGDYLSALDRAGVSSIAWATSERTNTNKLEIFLPLAPDTPVVMQNNQASAFLAHLGGRGYFRAITVSGGEEGFNTSQPTSPDGAQDPGTYQVNYAYPSASTYSYLASLGVTTVRIPFRWERIQPRLYGPLNQTELNRLEQSVNAARTAGLTVILDLHNYGGYYVRTSNGNERLALGGPGLEISAFVNVWQRLSAAFRSDSGLMYDIMNEPVEMPGARGGAATWQQASQAVVSALRRLHDDHWILVGGYYWAAIYDWNHNQPRPWIRDPANRIMYEAHQYFDAANAAQYAQTYSQEDATLAARGF